MMKIPKARGMPSALRQMPRDFKRGEIRAYMICTSPRSGSTMLCKLLAGTKLAGNPGSLFHEPSLAQWLVYHGLEVDAYASSRLALKAVFEAAIARGSGETDVFGLRMQQGSFAYFTEQLALLYPDETRDQGRIEAAFGKTLFIHLSRGDKLDQAISLLRAEQTGLWHRWADGGEMERQAPRRDKGYDFQALNDRVAELAAMDADWERWFVREGLAPLRVTYDGLTDNPGLVLAGILEALGLDPANAASMAPQTAKLSDATNLAWKRRFQQDRSR